MRTICVLLLLSLSACASRADAVVARASSGLGWDAHYHPTEGGDPKTLQFLQTRAEWFGISVEYRPDGHEDLRGAVGLSYEDGMQKYVLVNGDLSVNGRIEVLAHELGHMFQPPLASRMEHEVFAELVSVEVCKRFGVDSSKASARYLQADKSALSVGRTHRLEIAFVVDILTRGYR
jgi:hypothetical protein